MTLKKKEQSHTEAFDFWGCGLKETSSGQLVGYSPFADKEGKLYVNPDTGQWDCKVTGESGNVYTFLTKLYEQLWNETDDALYEELSELRNGLPVEQIEHHAWAFDGNQWVIPIHNYDGSLVNLRTWNPKVKKPTVMGTASMDNHIYRSELLKDADTVFICEGEFDTIALEYLLEQNNIEGAIVGLPGVHTFKDEWAVAFDGKKIYLCFDNDSAADKALEKHPDKLAPYVEALYYIKWTSNFADGYDISNLLADNIDNPEQAWKELEVLFEPVDVELVAEEAPAQEGELIIVGKHIRLKLDLTDKPITSFNTVLKHYRKHIYLSKKMEEGLAIIFATLFAVQIPGDPLWLFVIAPAGSGKTLILTSLSSSPYAFYQSRVRASSIVSGFPVPDGHDPSLIRRFMGRCVIFKDWTEIVSMPRGDQEDLYGIMRGAFDGRVDVHYGNGIDRVYDPCYFGVIAGVTPIIHRDQRATLGERFLKYDLIGDTHNQNGYSQDIQIETAIRNTIEMKDAEHELEETAKGFTSREIDLDKLPTVPTWAINKTIALSKLVGSLRATVERGTRGEISYRPRTEISTRLAVQFTRLAIGLCIVYGKKQVDKEVFRLIQNVAMDTSHGWQLDLFRLLMNNTKGKSGRLEPMTVEEMAEKGQISVSSIRRKLDDMLELKIVSYKRIVEGQRGRPTNYWSTNPQLKELWKKTIV